MVVAGVVSGKDVKRSALCEDEGDRGDFLRGVVLDTLISVWIPSVVKVLLFLANVVPAT